MAAVPFKYAQRDVKGIVYVVSFGLGAAMVRLQPQVALVAHTTSTENRCRNGSSCCCRPCRVNTCSCMQVTVVAACIYATALLLLKRPLPSMQCKVAAGPAILTGALWSMGNFLSIYAVEYLGLSLGWPMVQCQLIISSLWCALPSLTCEIRWWRELRNCPGCRCPC